MANPQNLKPFTGADDPRRVNGSVKKGIPHAKTRYLRFLALENQITNPINKEIENMTVAEQLDLAQIRKAREGDTTAYNAIMDRLEGKPLQTNTNINTDVDENENVEPEKRLQEVLQRIKTLQES
jgi:hypothetical protein